MGNTTTKVTSGVNEPVVQDLLDKQDIAARTGAIGQIYENTRGKTAPLVNVAKLSGNQDKAYGRAEGTANAKAFQRELSNQVNALGEGRQVMSDFASGAHNMNPTGILSDAQQYANAAPIQQQLGAIDTATATNRQNLADAVSRQLNENALPSAQRQAVASGGFGGSRHNIAEGIARRGAAEALTKGQTQLDNAATMQKSQIMGNAFNTGLQSAIGTQNSNLARQQAAGGALSGLGLTSGQQNAQMDQMVYNNLMNSGAVSQGHEQDLLNAATRNTAIKRDIANQDMSNYLNNLNAAAGLAGSTTSTNTRTGSMNSNDWLNQGIAAAGGILAQQFKNTGSGGNSGGFSIF